MSKIHAFIKDHPACNILLKSVFYAAVLLALLYLYHYRHFGEVAFIYNEF
jgi:hypothetical protein